MRVVCGGKHPASQWRVVDEQDQEILFDPQGAVDAKQSLQLCLVFVHYPEHQQELQEKFSKPLNIDDDLLGALIV